MIYCIKPVITGSLSEKDPYGPDIRIPDRYGSFLLKLYWVAPHKSDSDAG